MKYRYIKGGPHSHEAVEFDITGKDGNYVTTCVVNINLLLCGIFRFPCGNGDDFKITDEQHLDILRKVKQERQKYTDVKLKTLQGWHDSGICSLSDYIQVGDTVSDVLVSDLINAVPPVSFRSCCIQLGEAYSSAPDENGKYRQTYTTFHRTTDGNYIFDGYCYKDENINRDTRPTKLDKWLSALEGENE